MKPSMFNHFMWGWCFFLTLPIQVKISVGDLARPFSRLWLLAPISWNTWDPPTGCYEFGSLAAKETADGCVWNGDIHGYYMIYTMTIDNDIQYFTHPSFSQWGKWWCIEIGDTPLTQSHGVSYGWQEDSCKVVKLGIYQLEVLTIRFITKCTAVAHLDETNPNYCGQMSTHISLGLIL